MLFLQDWWLLCQKQLSNKGASNYVPQTLLGVITCPRSWYPLLKHNSSNINHNNGNRMENIAVIWEFCKHYRKSCLAIMIHHCDNTVAFQIMTHKSPWAGKSCKFKFTISWCFITPKYVTRVGAVHIYTYLQNMEIDVMKEALFRIETYGLAQ